jgi:glycosyltransferase involved in cell wall biosynthesis
MRDPVRHPSFGEGGSEESPLVLHVRSSGGLFGADRVVLDLCEALPPRGYRSLLVPLMESDGSGLALVKEAEARGIPVSPLHLKQSWDFAALRSLRHLARETGAAILHGHDYKSNVALLLAGKGSEKTRKRFTTLHGQVGTSRMLRLKESLDRGVINRFDGVICVSESQAKAEEKRGVRKITVVQNGIDPKPFRRDLPELNALRAGLGLKPGEQVIGAIGRLSEEKGYAFLLRICAGLLQRGREFKILLVGEGPQKHALQDLSRNLGIEDKLLLPGFRGETVSLHRVLDVFCMPSQREGLPLALLESMASGRAVIANAVGGIPEVLGFDGVSGILVTPDDEAAWTSSLGNLLEDPGRRAKLGAAAAQKVETYFSRESMTRGVAQVYAETPSL